MQVHLLLIIQWDAPIGIAHFTQDIKLAAWHPSFELSVSIGSSQQPKVVRVFMTPLASGYDAIFHIEKVVSSDDIVRMDFFKILEHQGWKRRD